MYPNLMGMKAFHGLTSDDMGNILGISRNAYESKMKSGRFTPKECKLKPLTGGRIPNQRQR